MNMNIALERRRLLQWMGLTASIASAPAWAAKAAQSDSVWPQDSRVPGGVARLSLIRSATTRVGKAVRAKVFSTARIDNAAR